MWRLLWIVKVMCLHLEAQAQMLSVCQGEVTGCCRQLRVSWWHLSEHHLRRTQEGRSPHLRDNVIAVVHYQNLWNLFYCKTVIFWWWSVFWSMQGTPSLAARYSWYWVSNRQWALQGLPSIMQHTFLSDNSRFLHNFGLPFYFCWNFSSPDCSLITFPSSW